MDEIDKLLSKIQADDRKSAKIPDRQPKVPPTQPASDIDRLLAEVNADFNTLPTASRSLKNDSLGIDNILSQVKADREEQDRVQSQNEQQRLQAEKLKQIEALKLHAKTWLKQLDPLSTEGLWFERFAEGYPTKLEAAINYLQES